jgi:hypothetical protein
MKPFHLILFVLVITIMNCEKPAKKIVHESDVAIAWADLTLYITKNTPANSPTYASRCLGYIGLTMYESVVNGYPEYNSIATQLNGLRQLPKPIAGKMYNWTIAMNTAQALILRNLYNQTSDENKAKIDSLESAIETSLSADVDKAIVTASIAYGRAVASAIYQWSLDDGGHRAYLANFDKKLQTPSKAGCWEPPLYGQSFSHYPLHPYWGKNRTFVLSNAELATPKIMEYDSGKTSEYCKQFVEVLDKSRGLSSEEKEIALWWGDDPGDTFTPPGHSYYLGTLVLKKQKPSLIKCAETYARIGLAVADAFINCWKWKYTYYSERPSSYISKKLDERWESFWPDPPFPAFPSGHATQAAAVATVLQDLYGKDFEFIDDAHVGRNMDEIRGVEFRARHYTSFWQVAEETAMSRFLGGIHTKQDNEVGLREGKKMGEIVNGLSWRKNTVIATNN